MSKYNKATEEEIRIEHARNVLRKAGFYVDNLWSVADVQSKFECDTDDAMEVLNSALTNEATMEQIWLAIGIHGDEENLTRIE